MRPARWRRSTHVVIGVVVLVLVAAVVAAAAVLTAGNKSPASASPVAPQPACGAPPPGVTPLADTARTPTAGGSDRRPRAACRQPGPRMLSPAGSPMPPPGARIVGAGRGRPDAAGVDQQGADHRGGAAHPGPRCPPDHHGACRPIGPGWSSCKVAGTRRCRRRRRPRRPGTATPPGSATSPTRCAVRHHRRPRCRSTPAPTAGRRWRPAGTRPTSTAVTSRPMESVMLDGGRTQPVSVDIATLAPRPALDAGRALAVALGVRPGHGHRRVRTPAGAPADRGGAVAAADRTAAPDDERVRQRDGRVDRPRGRRRRRTGRRASTAACRRCSAS